MFSFNDLPLEVLAIIYKYLDYKDIKAAQLTCRQWLNASHLHGFEKSTVLKFTTLEGMAELFKRSFRKFRHVHLKNKGRGYDFCGFTDEEIIQFFSLEVIKENLNVLILENFETCLSHQVWCELLKLLSNLSELICIGTELYCNTKNEKDFSKNVKIFSKVLPPTLKSFTFQGHDYNSENFQVFGQHKNLEKLTIHSYKENSRSNLLNIIKNSEKSLKNLSLNLHKSEHGLFLQSLAEVPNLKLKAFSLSYGWDWPAVLDKKFFGAQNAITYLYLHSSEIKDENISTILKNLPLLENLTLERCSALSGLTMVEISKLKNLKYLNINDSYDLTRNRDRSDLIANTLFKIVNNKITELRCENVSLSDEDYLKISENSPNLRVLHCSIFGTIALQYILKNCKNLINLRFSRSYIMDSDITEMGQDTKDKPIYCLSDLEKLVFLDLTKCEMDFNRLPYFLKFKNLKTLHLGRHFDPSDKNSLKSLAKNCPQIKEMSLYCGFCKSDYDYAIKTVIENFKELQIFRINGYCKCDHIKSMHYHDRSFCGNAYQNFKVEQHVHLLKYRKDLSVFETKCACEKCELIMKICDDFFHI